MLLTFCIAWWLETYWARRFRSPSGHQLDETKPHSVSGIAICTLLIIKPIRTQAYPEFFNTGHHFQKCMCVSYTNLRVDKKKKRGTACRLIANLDIFSINANTAGGRIDPPGLPDHLWYTVIMFFFKKVLYVPHLACGSQVVYPLSSDSAV